MSKLALLCGAALLTGGVLFAVMPEHCPENRSAPQLLMEAARNPKAVFQAQQTSSVVADGRREDVQARVSRSGESVRFEYAARQGQPARVVLERPEAVYVFWPTVKEGWHIPRRPGNNRPVACLQLCSTNYRWESDSVEGGLLSLTAFRRRDNRMTRRYWVDRTRQVVVGMQSYGSDAQPDSGWKLTAIEFKESLPAELFEPPATVRPALEVEHPQPAASLEEAAARVGFTPEIPNWLPDGYQLVELWSEKVQGRPSVRMVYSDGLETFSLLQARHTGEPTADESLVEVARSRQMELLQWSDGQLEYTLMGSVSNQAPRELARQLVQGETAPVEPERGVLPIWQRGWQRLGSLF